MPRPAPLIALTNAAPYQEFERAIRDYMATLSVADQLALCNAARTGTLWGSNFTPQSSP